MVTDVLRLMNTALRVASAGTGDVVDGSLKGISATSECRQMMWQVNSLLLQKFHINKKLNIKS